MHLNRPPPVPSPTDTGPSHTTTQARPLQAEYDIELQRNKYYGQKKEVVVEVLVGRAARVAALVSAAKSEAAHLANVRDTLEGIAERSAAMNAATQLTSATLSSPVERQGS